MNNNIFFDQIMNLPGLEEIKKILEQWNKISDNIVKMPKDAEIILPDLLWRAPSGVGKTHLIKLLSEYLYSKKLINFYGDVKYFEFLLEYCHPESYLTELSRLIKEVASAAGFRSEYRGVLAIDISLWNGHYDEPYFHRILEYLSSVDNHICVIFIIEDFQDDEVKNAENILSSFFRIRKINLSYPDTLQWLEYVVNKLEKYGLKLDSDAKNLLCETINELRETKYFDGYKTINRMCQDIAFELCTSDDFSLECISREKLARYSKDGEFTKSMNEIIKKRKIGFSDNR